MKGFLYFIALIVKGELSERIREIQLHCSEEYKSQKALRSPPHITLIPPFREDSSIEKVLEKKLVPFFSKRIPFSIELDGFGRFGNRVIYIRPVKNPYLESLQQNLHNYLSSEFTFIESASAREFNPHVTIASGDLSKKNFHPAWKEFESKTFKGTLNISLAHLLRHDGKKWEPVLEFSFVSK